MSKNNMQKVIAAPDKQVSKTSGANGVLSRLFRQVMSDLNVTGPRFGNLLQHYILDSRYGIPNNKKDQASKRGNMTRELASAQMTWKIFIKAMRILQFTKVEFIINCHHQDGKTSLHSTVVDFGTRGNFSKFNEALEQPENEEATIHVDCLLPYEEHAARPNNQKDNHEHDTTSN